MREIYLDNAATTRCREECAELAYALMRQQYGNPSSLHRKGFAAQQLLEEARRRIATAIGAMPEEVLFTSGGTEANNLAILGAAQARHREGRTIIGVSSAHASMLEPLRALAEQGYTVRLIDPLPDGHTDAESLVDAVDEDTILVCCELVGSEVGTVTPVSDLCRRIRRKKQKLHIHCDGVQGLRKTAFSMSRMGVDSLSLSAHKIGAVKGSGVLYLRKGVRIRPILYGGGQEKALRPGTESTPLAAAFGLAALRCVEELEQDMCHVRELHEHFVKKVGRFPDMCMNSPCDATPYINNISVPGYRSETLLHFLAEKGIYVSSGSACSKGKASHVLTAMGLPASRIDSALRISLCPENTIEELELFFEALQEGINTLARSRI